MPNELKRYTLSFFQDVHEFDNTPISFGFTIQANQKPSTMADWVGAVGERCPGTGGPDMPVVINKSKHDSIVHIVAVDGESLKPHAIRADSKLVLGSIVSFELEDRPYNPMKFKVTQNG